jgi:hypothetical protein
MAVTQKISVAMGRDELRLAKTAADEEGVSLSAFVTRAVRERLEERRRLEAARELLASFTPDELPSLEEEQQLLAVWTRPRAVKTRNGRPAKRRRATCS